MLACFSEFGLAQISSDSLTWVRTGGPPGGLGYDIRYNYDDPDIWYVTDNYAGVHISTDNGMTRQPANNGITPQSGPTGDATDRPSGVYILRLETNGVELIKKMSLIK